MKKELAAGYACRLLSVAGGVIILPFIMGHLSEGEFAIWIIFTTAFMFQNVLDFGFCSSFTRYFSYALSGRSCLEKNRLDISKKAEGIDTRFFSELYRLSKTIYASLAIISTAFCFCFYYFYLSVIQENYDVNITVPWIVLSAALVLQVYFLYLNSLLQGVGRILDVQLSLIVSNLIFITSALIFVYMGYGILGLAFARLLGSMSYRLYLLIQVRINPPVQFKIVTTKIRKENWEIVLSQSLKLGITSLCVYLNGRLGLFVGAIILTVSLAATYSLTANIFIVIGSISLVANNMYLPKIYRSMSSGDITSIKFEIKRISALGIGVIFIPVLFFLLFGEMIFEVIDSNVLMPPVSLLIVYSVLVLFDFFYQVSIGVLNADNDFAYVKSQLFSTASSILFVIIVISSDYTVEMYELVAISLLPQLVFNYWYWPLKVYRKLTNENKPVKLIGN